MIFVLDAGPLIAFLAGEAGADLVAELLKNNPDRCFAHVFNLTEVYYVFYRRGGLAAAETATESLLASGVIPREDADMVFWKDAARMKGAYPLALPDAFCLAMARRLSGTAVTTDHAEFDPLVSLNICPILFIR